MPVSCFPALRAHRGSCFGPMVEIGVGCGLRALRIGLGLLAAGLAAVPGTAAVFTSDGAWCWFSDARAVCQDGRIVAGWISRDGSVQIGSRSLTAAPTEPTTIVTLAPQFERDDHDHPALVILPDGNLGAFFSPHAHGDMQWSHTAAGRWQPPVALNFSDPTRGTRGTTYANPFILTAEHNALHLFWRGNDFKPTFATSPDLGATWSAPRTLISEHGRDTGNRPYVKYAAAGDAAIDFVFTDGHPRNEPANSVYFARYEAGAFWHADGRRIADQADLPLQPAACDRVYDGATAGRAWVWSIVADAAERPVIGYTRLPAENDHRYHYARWDGEHWQDHVIVAAGGWFPETPSGAAEREPHYSGGLALDPAHPGTVYLSRPVNGVFEIEAWTTTDGGGSWTHTALTHDSTAHNVRPFVVPGTPPGTTVVMWMHNRGGYRHYTDFDTELHYLVR